MNVWKKLFKKEEKEVLTWIRNSEVVTAYLMGDKIALEFKSGRSGVITYVSKEKARERMVKIMKKLEETVKK